MNSYNRTTLANIPPLHKNNHNITTEDILTPQTLFEKLHVNLTAEMPIQLRLYAIVICSWIVTYFLCIEIEEEWKDNLALRRRFYFEADHYDQEKKKRDQKLTEKVDYISKRDPWVPNPEERDTVVNIGLYSLLVGDIPPLPQELKDEGYTEQQEIDWQTAAVTTFFDNCVPNQPGFTSSIAAITILPSASSLNKAWKEWNKAASALRQLRCIRSEIDERRTNQSPKDDMLMRCSRRDIMKKAKEQNHQSSGNIFISSMSVDKKRLILANFDDDVEGQLMDALHYGPQQKACYGREFAQASASIFGNYFLSQKYKNANYEELVQFEEAALEDVEQANESLKKAQRKTIIKARKSFLSKISQLQSQEGEINNTGNDEVDNMRSLTSTKGEELIAEALTLSVKLTESDNDDIKLLNHENSLMNFRISGEWTKPAPKGLLNCLYSNMKNFFYSHPKSLVSSHKKSTYAIVTFTNR